MCLVATVSGHVAMFSIVLATFLRARRSWPRPHGQKKNVEQLFKQLYNRIDYLYDGRWLGIGSVNRVVLLNERVDLLMRFCCLLRLC